MSLALRVENLNVTLGQARVLESISFEIEEGDYVAILGPNGGGKSTLLRAILGLQEYEGRVEFFGENLKSLKKSLIGYVPQQPGSKDVSFPATVEEVVLSGRTASLGVWRRYGKEDRQIVAQAMEETEITELKDKRLANLSGGQRQRVWIARALAAQPKLLILDEPVAGVDLAAQERFYQLLARLNKERGLTLIFVSHDVGIMAQEASRFLCLNKRLVCHSSPENFIKEDFLKELYGDKVTSITHTHSH